MASSTDPSILYRLDGKVILVTGAGSSMPGETGIGQATSIHLSRLGANVALLDYNVTAAQETYDLIAGEGNGDRAIVVKCDVGSEESCKEAVEKVKEKWARVDGLVNNVGVAGPIGNALDVDLVAWERDFRINVTGMLLMARYAIPEMTKAGGGSIVNMGSISGMRGGTPSILYPTAKGAVIQMTRAMAQHHGPDLVRVNSVSPGAIFSSMVGGSTMPPEIRAERANDNLLKTEGTAWDIAHSVAFLLGDGARWVTGINLVVDGGATAGTPKKAPVPGALPHLG